MFKTEGVAPRCNPTVGACGPRQSRIPKRSIALKNDCLCFNFPRDLTGHFHNPERENPELIAMLTHFIPRLLISILLVACSCANATPSQEPVDMELIQKQLEVTEHIANRANTTNTPETSIRYRFDYLRLIHDIQRIRHGVQDYLSPSRAQPRDPTELVGNYRLDTSSEKPSP
ncbi:RAQPRD family integrative conjugative element protein [Pseudomonas fluorescens]|uniref:integrative conjugative element protein, RAQPRD family n=2 Tax=unclassified Pseudomonas TaxID=196821 RepID=UPI002989E631